MADGDNRQLAILRIADQLRLDMPGTAPAPYIDGWAEYIYEHWVENKIIVGELSDGGLDDLLEELIPR